MNMPPIVSPEEWKGSNGEHGAAAPGIRGGNGRLGARRRSWTAYGWWYFAPRRCPVRTRRPLPDETIEYRERFRAIQSGCRADVAVADGSGFGKLVDNVGGFSHGRRVKQRRRKRERPVLPGLWSAWARRSNPVAHPYETPPAGLSPRERVLSGGQP
jgi:hypothetical protein